MLKEYGSGLMPSLTEEILILLKEGHLFHISDPLRQFQIDRPYNPASYYNAIHRLTEKGHIKKTKGTGQKDKKIHIKLTEQGKKYIKKHQESIWRVPRKWDKKWRLVVFDIPEEKRVYRDHLRRYLKILGFGKVQRSIWVSPYDFTKIIKRYAGKLNIAEYIFQITADKFQGFSESALVRIFWNIESIHNKYLGLIERYKERQKELSHKLQTNSKKLDLSKNILKEQMIWDYQSIKAHDPHLPPEFLPDDWGGEQVRKFIETFYPSTQAQHGQKNSRGLK